MTTIMKPFVVSSSTSKTADYVEQQRRMIHNMLQESNALGFAAKGTFQQIDEIFNECSSGGWDGYEALPVTKEAVQYARRFLDSFPWGFEAPEISAEPDGDITLEWYRSPKKVISISINSDGWLNYAALVGSTKRHGADYALMGASEDLLSIIYRVIQTN